MWTTAPVIEGWTDPEGDYHSFFPPEIFPTALQYAGLAGHSGLGQNMIESRFYIQPHSKVVAVSPTPWPGRTYVPPIGMRPKLGGLTSDPSSGDLAWIRSDGTQLNFPKPLLGAAGAAIGAAAAYLYFRLRRRR